MVRAVDALIEKPEIEVRPRLHHEFGPAGRWLARRYFEAVRFPQGAVDELKALHQKGLVVHVMRTTAWVNFLYLHWAMVRRGLPPVRAVVNLRPWFTRPFTLAAQRGDFDVRFTYARRQGGSGLIFLRESAFNSARGKDGEDPFPALVEMARKSDTPVFLVPELFVWEKWLQKITPSVFDRVFGSPEAPGFLHSVGAFFRNYKRAQFRVGDAIDLNAFVADHAGQPTEVIARKVRSTLHHHLARETRAVFGPPRKSTDRLIDEAMRDRVFQQSVAEISKEQSKSVEALNRAAKRSFAAIAARYSPTVVGFTAPILHWVFNRIYDGVEVDEAGLERAMKAASDAPVVLTPSHKSHVDYLIMSYVLFQRGYTVPLVAAGANLSFFPLGPFLRRGGAFFLRRSFKGDKLYTAVFKAYLKKLVHDGIHHEFFPEGGRSRTGKLLPPKLGLFTWLVDAVIEGARNELLFVPVAIDYEKVVEGASYRAELAGGEKKPEDLKALLSAPSVLTENYGRIHLTFDEPVSVAKLMKERGIDPRTATDDQKKALVRALGHRVMHGISRVSTVTPHALLASALLAHRRRGISVREITDRVMLLRRMAADLNAPLSIQLKDSPSSPTVLGPIADAMRMFAGEGFVRIVEARGEPIYQVEEDRRTELTFYKNTLMNLIAGRTIVCAAILSSEPERSIVAIRERALVLSRLLKMEFIYPVGQTFEHIFDATVVHLTGLGLVVRGEHSLEVAPEAHVRPSVQFLSDLLLDVLESYHLAARQIADAPKEGQDKKDFIKKALENGRADFLGGTIISAEAVSKSSLENALTYLVEQGFLTEQSKRLVPGKPVDDLVAQLKLFLPEVR
ncbi:MAG: 1-acyl-sn-glycerol-3-phosphate acyltransferase [Myxococcus sp.]|nr:1-acyl-sn-glycerol-3-phosphate acyltransferase [Myxococcus sp.]